MCYWQRWPHFAALAFALLSFAPMADKGRSLVWLAAFSILVSGMIGVYHAGVEAGIFEGLTQCTAAPSGGSVEDLLAGVLDTPMIRCDEVQWSLFGVSMAGWNAIISIGSFLVIAWLSVRRPRPQS